MGTSCVVRDLVKAYGDRRVVDDVSIEIAGGEFLVILGPSGCGKTTTLRLIAGLETPDGGTIEIGGTAVTGSGLFVPPERRGVGMVFQSYAIWPHMTVEENVAFPLRVRKHSSAERKRAVEEALKLVGLEGMGSRPASALSGGQMQRVALARAMVYNPTMLLFDEPLSNLDLKLRERLRIELKEMQRRTGLTSIYVTHDQTEAVELADRIAVMQDGKIVQLATPAELYQRPATRFVAEFISSANIFAAKVESLAGAGLATVIAGAGGRLVASYDGQVQPGDEVEVVLHPEDCRLLTPGEEGTPVAIVERRFQGTSARYRISWHGLALEVVSMGTQLPVEHTEHASLLVTAGAPHILPRR